MNTNFCWWCSRSFENIIHKTTVTVHGYEHAVHKACAASESMYNEQHQLTAQLRQKQEKTDED